MGVSSRLPNPNPAKSKPKYTTSAGLLRTPFRGDKFGRGGGQLETLAY